MSEIYCILNLSEHKTHKIMNDKGIYCNTLDITNQEFADFTLTKCGINLMMDNNKIVREPDVILFFKGELYNLQLLCDYNNLPENTSPESMIIHLYKSYGIDYTLEVLEGVFIFILFDYDYRCDISKLYMVRDPFGIIPFYGNHTEILLYFHLAQIFIQIIQIVLLFQVHMLFMNYL
jgi:asparagine synthetase B (glutamine-hydrolysing)